MGLVQPIRSLYSRGVQSASGPRVVSLDFTGQNEPLISQGGLFTMHGHTTGLDWADVRVTNGIAHGLHKNEPFSDPTSLIALPWSPDQEAEGRITGVGTQGEFCGAECELRFRSVITPHVNRGYELLWATRPDNNYLQWVRWNGAIQQFAELQNWNAPVIPVNNYWLRGRAEGTNPVTLTWWILDQSGSVLESDVIQDASPLRWLDGSIGLGFWRGGSCLGDLSTQHQFGFTRFIARDYVAA